MLTLRTLVCPVCGKTFQHADKRVVNCSKVCGLRGRYGDLKTRFWAKVDRKDETGCWIWTGSVNAPGYGSVRLDRKRLVLAHRLSYEWAVGPIPAGLELLHSCDTPACVNPLHLRPGTHAENMAEMATRGRSMRGRSNEDRRKAA